MSSPLENQHCILFEKLPRGAMVNCSQGWVYILTKAKGMSDKTVAATVLYGPADQVGRYEPDWCADMLDAHD